MEWRKIYLSTIGEFIKLKRMESNITMSDLAEKIGTSQSAMSFIENNKRIPNIETLKKIASALDLTDEEIDKLILKRTEVFDTNRKIRNEFMHGLDNKKDSFKYYRYFKKDIGSDLIIEFLDGYTTEINIKNKRKIDNKNASTQNDVLISTIIENAIVEVIYKEKQFLMDSIKKQFVDYIYQVEELLDLVKDKNEIEIKQANSDE